MSLVDERKRLIENGDQPVAKGSATSRSGKSAPNADITSDMIAKEKHKLEVLKRRQEKDLQQVGCLSLMSFK